MPYIRVFTPHGEALDASYTALLLLLLSHDDVPPRLSLAATHGLIFISTYLSRPSAQRWRRIPTFVCAPPPPTSTSGKWLRISPAPTQIMKSTKIKHLKCHGSKERKRALRLRSRPPCAPPARSLFVLTISAFFSLPRCRGPVPSTVFVLQGIPAEVHMG